MPLPLIALALGLAPLLKDFIPRLPEALGGSRAAEVAQGVVQVATALTGQDEPSPAAMGEAMQDPERAGEVATALAQLNADVTKALAAEETARLMAALADIQGARARDLELRKAGVRRFMPGVLLFIAGVAVFGFGCVLVFGSLQEGSASQAAIIQQLTIFAGIIVTAAAFEWGSSYGSRNKDVAPGPLDVNKMERR